MRKRGFIPFLFLLLGCGSCATFPVSPPPPPPEELLVRIQARSQNLLGLKGLAYVQVSAPGKSFRVQEVILARRPADLRLESLSPLGNPQFYLATDGRELNLYNPGENRYYRGRTNARYFSSLLPLPLDPEEIVTLLLGSFPILPHSGSSVHFEPQENLWILELNDSSREAVQTLGVEPQSGQVSYTEYRLRGVTRRLSFGDFRVLSNLSFPYQIHFEAPESKTKLRVEYTDAEINPVWERGDFHLPVPRGAQIIPLE
jgi:hypothetical protein